MRLNILILLFISSTAWSNEPLTKADFAYGVEAALETHQVYEFTVNEPIYRYLQNDDLRDLRIFDERGVMVPIKIIAPSQAERTKIVHYQNKQELHFFPVTESSQQPIQDLNVYVKRNNDGTIVNINSVPIAEQQQQDVYYIVDMGEKRTLGIHAIEIDWDGDKAPKAAVNIQTSDDLSNWQLSGQGAIFRLRHNSQLLLRNHVPVRQLKRYLRIQLSNTEQGVLVGLKGLIEKSATSTQEPLFEQATLLKQSKTQFYYQIPGEHPVNSLRVYPQEDDAIYTIRLVSGESVDMQSRIHYSSSIYKLTIGNETFTANPIHLTSAREHRYWRIDVLESNQPEISAPSIEFAYYPHRIRFLSNQAGKYTIAFGSATVNKFGPAIPRGIDNADNNIQTLELTAAHALSGEEKLTPPAPPKDYKKLILWSILALVLVVMGYMVTRLLRHMREA